MTSTDPPATGEELPPIPRARRFLLVTSAAVGLAAVVGLLQVADADHHLHRAGPSLLVFAGFAAGVALATRVASAGPGLILVGGAVAADAAWLLGQRSDPGVAAMLALLFGLGIWLGVADAPVVPGRTAVVMLRRFPDVVVAAGVVLVAMIVLGHTVPRHVVALVTAGAALTTAVLEVVAFAPEPASNRGRAGAFGTILVVVTLVLTGYIGAETPSATWFGGGAVHGPTDRAEVALTFDDGPNPGATEQIMRILDAHGVKGTFFQVGKAIDAEPQITRALYDDGQLLGNHSYHHDQWRWLDPRYPELARTQDAFRRAIGTCPVLFRPPHGDRTPFLARVVRDRHMHMVLWSASAGDWATDDAQLVARRILDQVRAGTIVDLHDGLDGNPAADRSVVARALPIILDGLRAKGLTPVRLDRLLGTGAYQPC